MLYSGTNPEKENQLKVLARLLALRKRHGCVQAHIPTFYHSTVNRRTEYFAGSHLLSGAEDDTTGEIAQRVQIQIEIWPFVQFAFPIFNPSEANFYYRLTGWRREMYKLNFQMRSLERQAKASLFYQVHWPGSWPFMSCFYTLLFSLITAWDAMMDVLVLDLEHLMLFDLLSESDVVQRVGSANNI